MQRMSSLLFLSIGVATLVGGCRSHSRDPLADGGGLRLDGGVPPMVDSGGEPPGMPLEIGTIAPDGSFVPLNDGDSMEVVLSASGLNMIMPSLRAVGVNPVRPDPNVEVEVSGHTMAMNLLGERVDMEPDGDGYVLPNVRVPFQTELCCYVCTEGTVMASLQDGSGHTFEGQVTVRFERGGCPDVSACCVSAGACPDPALTLVCE